MNISEICGGFEELILSVSGISLFCDIYWGLFELGVWNGIGVCLCEKRGIECFLGYTTLCFVLVLVYY